MGANLRQARQKAGLTQEDVAARTGIRRPHVSDVECDANSVALETVVNPASAIEVEV